MYVPSSSIWTSLTVKFPLDVKSTERLYLPSLLSEPSSVSEIAKMACPSLARKVERNHFWTMSVYKNTTRWSTLRTKPELRWVCELRVHERTLSGDYKGKDNISELSFSSKLNLKTISFSVRTALTIHKLMINGRGQSGNRLGYRRVVIFVSSSPCWPSPPPPSLSLSLSLPPPSLSLFLSLW